MKNPVKIEHKNHANRKDYAKKPEDVDDFFEIKKNNIKEY
jgi:hypothetical protein